jgi:hypothetical protein
MSRSNPSSNSPNPSTRWFEWDGANGGVRYYDKEKKENVRVPSPFSFLVLDELSTVRGWHDASDSGIYANEVRDTKQDVLIVKSFKGGIIAEGLYAAIRDRIGHLGGHFTLNMYVAYKADDGKLALGSLQLKGAALNAWVEFRKAHRADVNTKAVVITGQNAGKKGKVVFQTPVFGMTAVSKERNDEALELDRGLQEYLKGYLSQPRSDAAASASRAEALAAADAAFADTDNAADDRAAEQEVSRQEAKSAPDAPFVDDLTIPF